MNAVILVSLVIASAMAAPAPQVLQPGLTLQSTGGIPAAFLTSSPQLFTTQQFVQQPAFIAAQTAIQQEEALEAQEQQQEAQQLAQQQEALVRDPSNPTADIFLHSGFPLVSQLSGAQTGVQSPFTLSTSPFTRVGITSPNIQQQAQPAQLVAAPQAQSAQLVAAPQASSAQLVAAPQQQSAQFFTTTGQQFQTQQVAAVPQQQQTFTIQPFQATSVQQPQQLAVQQPAAATGTQFSSGPLIFTTSQQQPSALTGFRTVATPFTFQTVTTQ